MVVATSASARERAFMMRVDCWDSPAVDSFLCQRRLAQRLGRLRFVDLELHAFTEELRLRAEHVDIHDGFDPGKPFAGPRPSRHLPRHGFKTRALGLDPFG